MSDNDGRLPEEEEEYEDDDEELGPLEDEISEDEGAAPQADDMNEAGSSKPSRKVVETQQKKGKKEKKRSIFIDDAAEEDEDERRHKRSRFIDDIAEVDDDEEEEEDEEGVDDLIDDRGEVPDAADIAEVRRAYREAALAAANEEDINPEELQRYLKERFGKERVAAYMSKEGGEITGAVSQQALMPTIRDPKLWVVRCVDGAEREVVVCLLQKCYEYAARGQPLLIKSAFAKDKLKGYLYVEAYKEAHVREAMKGLRGMFPSKAPKLVPLPEMVAAITIIASNARAIAVGSWVRPKSGPYKGDLGRVTSVDVNAGRATVRLVPRLDYGAMAARRAEGKRGFEKGPKVRPNARAFMPDEAKAAGLDVAQQRDRVTGDIFLVLNGSQRFSQGYLVKSMALKSLSLQETLPPLDELQRFNAAHQDGDGPRAAGPNDLASLVQELGVGDAASLEAAAMSKFAKGDRVIVVQGDLKDIRGRVELVTDDGQVMVMPTDESLEGFKEAIGFASRELAKYFDSGDHVKVTHGTHVGETGMVVKVEGGVCHVITDATRKEVRVFARDLTEAVTVATTLESLGDYDLFDLVLLDQQTVGVIVDVGPDSCRVLTNQGMADNPEIRICRLPDMKRKLNNTRATAQDGHRNEVAVNDVVDVKEGPLKGRSGTVRHIIRNFLFIRSREIQENGGFMCVLARHCDVRGGQRPTGGIGGAPFATPARTLATPNPYTQQSLLASPSHRSSGAGPVAGRGGSADYAGRLATQQSRLLEGKEVDIKKGPYRGMKGKIKSATATHLRVELEAQYKTVTVDRQHVALEDGGLVPQRAPMGMGMGMGMGQAYGMAVSHPGGRTPAHYFGAGPTPAHYTATPMHPSMTPGRDAVTKTPAYDPAWAATPAHPGFSGASTLPAQQPMMGYGGGGGMYSAGYSGAQPSSMPTFQAPVPAASAVPADTVPGPIGNADPESWVGLEVRLPTGEHAAVRTVGRDGTASVQIGQTLDKGGYTFSNGSMRSVQVKELALVPIEKRDVVRILGGDVTLSGKEAIIEAIDGTDGFVKLGTTGIQSVQLQNCAKLALG